MSDDRPMTATDRFRALEEIGEAYRETNGTNGTDTIRKQPPTFRANPGPRRGAQAKIIRKQIW